MKLEILIFWILLWAWFVFGQDVPVPRVDDYSALSQPWLIDTNPQPVIRNHARLEWQLSKSAGVVTQQLWATITIPYQWFFVEGFSNWVTNATVAVTNYQKEFFALRVANTSVWTQLPQ